MRRHLYSVFKEEVKWGRKSWKGFLVPIFWDKILEWDARKILIGTLFFSAISGLYKNVLYFLFVGVMIADLLMVFFISHTPFAMQ
ncbi:MAG: hypothetical protein DRM99_00170 [Thermoplasmata archaeon]|nr:MAG: hypothetical protein DRM99_00170 [Thermoplasmata archaeon]RLF51393.1 MAG: hypothetical protein DRN24_05055 [Thermoplasmata archaeon]